jgi:hypothetical protein
MKLLSISLFMFSLLVVNSCTKDKTVFPSQNFVCSNQTSISYSVNVSPIINHHCAIASCHQGANSSGIYLTTYTNTKESFEQGNSLCTIKHEAGCKPMPYPTSTGKLPDSLIAIIDCWAQKGFLE